MPDAPRILTRNRADEPWRLPVSTPTLIGMVGGKGMLRPPPGGWNAVTFRSRGRLLILTLARVAKLTQRRATSVVAHRVVQMIRRQVENTIRIAETSAGVRTSIEFSAGQLTDMWMNAIEEAMRDAGIRATASILPPVQSVMAQAYSQASTVLGQNADEAISARFVEESMEIAQKITRVSETTRDQLRDTILDGIAEGRTVTELSSDLRDTMDGLAHTRSLTIARTELNNAWTKGATASYQESETITHVSVIGCEAREDNSPQYRGESTCNIEDVPIADADKLEWHINHTGTLIPSQFAEP